MTKSEWLAIGYQNGIIDLEDYTEITLKDAYREWFLTKTKCIKKQSADRIEVTYNRYYADSPLIEKCISKITEKDIIEFLTTAVLKNGHMSYKEFARLFQIINNTLVYMRDINKGGAKLIDWNAIKRNIPQGNLCQTTKQEYAVPDINVTNITKMVLNKVYFEKQSACLCLCMNFYLGLRIGELAALSFRDFDFTTNTIRVTKTESKFYNRNENGEKIGAMSYHVTDSLKTENAVRIIPILPEVKYFYEEIKKHHDNCKYVSPYLAYDGKDTILVRSLDRTLRRLCVLCDVDYFNSHEIRKTFASRLHHNGVPTRVISDLMGHSEIKTTENNYILPYADDYEKVYQYMKQSLTYN